MTAGAAIDKEVTAGGRNGAGEENLVEAAATCPRRKWCHRFDLCDDLGADLVDESNWSSGSWRKTFDLEIPDTDAEKIATVEDAVKYIESKIS